MTTAALLGLTVLVLLVGAYLVWRRAAPPRPARIAAKRSVAPRETLSGAAFSAHAVGAPANVPVPWPSAPAEAAAAQWPVPPALATFRFHRADELAVQQHEALVAALRQISRPPRSLHKLISPAFLASASSTEMSELVASEPLVAAKVLSTVNSPLYALQQPVANIGQAITFLGMNTVRGICVRYMLDESFQIGDAATQRTFEQLWAASALASELCLRSAQQLQLPDAGALVTQVVLYFVGHMAVATLPQCRNSTGLTDLSLDLTQRYHAQQQALGLCAPDIGRLLMSEWELPASIVESVGDIDRVLITPAQGLDATTALRRALPYLSARLAERLAAGTLADLASWELATDEAPSSHHLRGYLSAKQQTALQQVFGSADTQKALRPLLA